MAGTPNLVALQKSRVELAKALQQLNTEVKGLEAKIKTADARTADAIKTSRKVLKTLNTDLLDTLDKALNEKNAAKQQAAYASVVKAFKGIATHVTSDPALKMVEDNPLGVRVQGVAAVKKALSSLGKTLT